MASVEYNFIKTLPSLVYHTFQIEGGHKLDGVIIPQGAKNEALQILCAVLLTKEKITISNGLMPNLIKNF